MPAVAPDWHMVQWCCSTRSGRSNAMEPPNPQTIPSSCSHARSAASHALLSHGTCRSHAHPTCYLGPVHHSTHGRSARSQCCSCKALIILITDFFTETSFFKLPFKMVERGARPLGGLSYHKCDTGSSAPLRHRVVRKHTPPFFLGYPSPSAVSPWYPHAQL